MVEHDGISGMAQRRFIYGPGIDEPVCMQRYAGGGWFYYHFDGLGNVVAISNDSNEVVEIYEYDVFGAPTIWDVNAATDVNSSIVGNPYMFTGRRYDDETGLYYYRARYYDPYIGRFMQTDPIRYATELNLYTYCWNNPVNWLDPWGLQPYFPPGSVPADYVPFPDKDVPPMPVWVHAILGPSVSFVAAVAGTAIGGPGAGYGAGFAAAAAYTAIAGYTGEKGTPPKPPKPPPPDDGPPKKGYPNCTIEDLPPGFIFLRPPY